MAYGKYALAKPDSLKIVAVAEADPVRLDKFRTAHKISDSLCFTDWKVPLSNKIADIAIIATMDHLHLEPSLAALESGYNIILEKPMDITLEGCRKIVGTAKRTGRFVSVAHVLRYTSFFLKIKQIIDEGTIGRIIHLSLRERIGYFHMAHSYVRGNWGNSKKTAPIILTKSSHDLDILCWLTGKRCIEVFSSGGLSYFKKTNLPSGAGDSCLDCSIERNCPYSAKKIYIEQIEDWEISKTLFPFQSGKKKEEELAKSPYGKCVFLCDNDVVDYQTAFLNFRDVYAEFSLTAFSADKTREIGIFGTSGDLKGDFEMGTIEIRLFGGKRTIMTLPEENGLHGGGDFRLLDDTIERLRNGKHSSLSSPEESLQSHELAFACEESRLSHKPVIIETPDT
jgi:predicted dehydrogenase